jgi:uncharacterized beta barrel domain-containing protein DUF5777
VTTSAFVSTPLALLFAAFIAQPSVAHGQTPAPGAAPATASTATPPAQTASDDDDGKLDPVEPDFVVINLPTTLRLPVHSGNFHLTHRFEGNLRDGSFTDQLSNFFGVDVGAAMSFEYRFGIMRHLELIASRANRSRAIEFSAKYDGWHQSATLPVSVSGIVSVEGDNNFGANSGTAPKNYAPALGVVLSREVGSQLALYATPFWVGHTGTSLDADGNTGFLGLGARVRLGPASSTYVSGEISPRIGGFVTGDPEYGFAIEKRVGAHVFALTFTNGTSNTTYRQLARGGSPGHLHLGFNLTRKFF